MVSPNTEVFLVILILEGIVGLFSSLSMIACLSAKEFQKKNLMTYSKILIPQNVSTLCYTIGMSINFYISFLWPELNYMASVFYTVLYMNLYSITSSLWLSSVLCVFYFMKIIPSQPGVFTALKSRIDAVVRWLIILSEVLSLGGSFLSLLIPNLQINPSNSSLPTSNGRDWTDMTFMETVLILNSLPFLIIMMTSIGSAWFLRLYNFQIQKNLATSGMSGVRGYRAAFQTMVRLLVFHISVLFSIIIFTLNVFGYPSWGYWVCVMFLFSFSPVLSVLHIIGNPKLKECFLQMFPSRVGSGDGCLYNEKESEL
ncbi:hypothetical protein GDO81_025944 [Engystomops pustulosus]|uniref:Taste receptor type 2 n=1 Tax=Engystomops pustulosus TaxID=76066 RepID=A0AAV6ZNS1_ENGPU|nr:hypothetical protein GDO81_025944 [Engystomops pustulosus]